MNNRRKIIVDSKAALLSAISSRKFAVEVNQLFSTGMQLLDQLIIRDMSDEQFNKLHECLLMGVLADGLLVQMDHSGNAAEIRKHYADERAQAYTRTFFELLPGHQPYSIPKAEGVSFDNLVDKLSMLSMNEFLALGQHYAASPELCFEAQVAMVSLPPLRQAVALINPHLFYVWDSYFKMDQLLASVYFEGQAKAVVAEGKEMLKSLTRLLKEFSKQDIQIKHDEIIMGTLKLALSYQQSKSKEAFDGFTIGFTGQVVLERRDFSFIPKQIEAIPQLGPLLDKIPQIKQHRYYLEGLNNQRLTKQSYRRAVAKAWFFGALTLIPGVHLIRVLSDQSYRRELAKPLPGLIHFILNIVTPVAAYFHLKIDLAAAKIDQFQRNNIDTSDTIVKVRKTLEAFNQERQTKRENKAALAVILAKDDRAPFDKAEGKPRKQVCFLDDDGVEKVEVYMDTYQLERHKLFQKPVIHSEFEADRLRALHADLQAMSVDLDHRIQSGPR